MTKEKTDGQKLREQLVYDLPLAWDVMNETEKKQVFEFAEGYKTFLDIAKTEREAVDYAVQAAEKRGFKNLDAMVSQCEKLKTGDKIYRVKHDKTVLLAVMGTEPLEKGLNITGAHVDSPRLDLKPNPLYEETNLAFFKTHYYGGIKKYQWVTIPLALHGVVIRKDGSKVNIIIGEKDTDPILYITDLLPHLAKDQMDKKLAEGITGEGLNILVGSLPHSDKEVKDRVELAVLEYLNKEYGMIEEDFLRAELEIVPAGKARDLGLDRSMVAGYGHDDRICAYTELQAIFEVENPVRTAVCILQDKEEIGSAGATGAESKFFENTVAEMVYLSSSSFSDILVRRALENSKMLSADVNAAADPNFEGVLDQRNCAYLGKGLVVTKYTGARGKSGASDANAEFCGEITNLFNQQQVCWQAGELGKVDQGGGGTIASFLAAYGMEVIDVGVPLLSMHAPLEVASKIDLYMAYKGYITFFKHII